MRIADSGINKNKEDGEIPKDYGMHIEECRMQETIQEVKGYRIAPPIAGKRIPLFRFLPVEIIDIGRNQYIASFLKS